MPNSERHTLPSEISFIGFAGADWWYHNRAHSDFQILVRLARNHPVLIVNSIGMRMPMPGRTSRFLYKIWRKLKSVLRFLRRPDASLPNLYIFSPLPFPFYHNKTARRFNAWFLRQQVRAAAWWVGIRKPTIFITPPTAWPVVSKMDCRALVYNRSDKHRLFAESDQTYIEELESALFKHSDLILYVNGRLLREESEQTGDRAHLLDHGVDLDLFRLDGSAAEPTDLQSIPKPRIGFFGSLRSYMVDFPLLCHVARNIPEAQLVFIGDTQDSIEEFDGIENVHFLGFKEYAQVPHYGLHFDVALMPYRDNEWIRYCNPIKLKEYLALGLPTVSTDFPEAHRYQEHISIAKDADDFVAKIRHVLGKTADNGSRTALRQVVEHDTWDNRVDEFLTMLDDVTKPQR